jgi:hypothetical protein
MNLDMRLCFCTADDNQCSLTRSDRQTCVHPLLHMLYPVNWTGPDSCENITNSGMADDERLGNLVFCILGI